MSQQPVTGYEIDQGFQGLKSREVSDAMRPDEMQFQSTALKYPNSGGWNVQSAAEVSPDGRAYRTETVATTDGVENIDGGKAEFQGFNEQRSSGLHQGDDKNFVKQSMESSKTHLQEKFVSGDANSDHLEVRTSSSTQSSSSKVVQSSSTVEYDNGYAPSNQQLLKNTYQDATAYGKQYFADDHHVEKVQQQEYYNKQNRNQSLSSEEVQTKTVQYNEKLENKSAMQNVETHQTVENERRYIDMDKASPEYQRHVQYLMSQPGEIISNTVEYPKPNVKMITTVKRLPDGTIVRNKRYETEEVGASRPLRENLQTMSNTKRVHSQQINDQKTNLRTVEDHLETNQRGHSRDDYTVHDTHSNELTNVKISSTKKSNEKYATESTTKVIHEYDEDNYRQAPNSSPQRVIHKAQSPHNNYPSYGQREPVLGTEPSRNYTDSPHSLDSTRVNDTEYVPSTHVYEKHIPTDEGEVLVVTSEKRQNVKKQSSSQRTTQTKVVADDIINYEQYPQVRDSSPKKILDEFHPVKGPSPKMYETEPNVNQVHGVPSDHERRGTPSERAANQLIHVKENTERTTAHKALENRRTLNEEHTVMLEHDNIRTPEKFVGPYHSPVYQRKSPDFQTREFLPQGEPTTSTKHPEKTALEPSSKQHTTPDFTTQGFPSQVKPSAPSNICVEPSNRRGTPDFTTQGFPSQVKPSAPSNICVEPSNRRGTPDFTTQGFPSQVKPSTPSNIYTEPSTRRGTPDFTTQGFPSQINPTVPTKYADNTYVEPSNEKNVPDFSTQGFPSQVKMTSPTKRPDNINEDIPYGTKPSPKTYNRNGTQKKPSDKGTVPDFSSHGFPSQIEPTTSSRYPEDTYGEPFARKPDTSPRYPGKTLEPYSEVNQKYPYQDNSLPSMQHPSSHSEKPGNLRNQKSPSVTTTPSYPSTYDEPSEQDKKHPKSPQGYPSQTKPSTPIKKPTSNVVEITQKIIKKEREVDAAHRAFASSLRSSSPIESRRDSYMDTQRHTPRSSVSSNRTFKRDMRESSHDSSAPSETSRTSTNTVTKRIPSKTLQTKHTVPITNRNVNAYEANRKNTKSPVNRNVISPQTTRTPLGGTTLREPFKSEEPSNLPASSRKDFTNSKHKIPSDDTYPTTSHNQPFVESPQSMRNNERRTVSNETSLTMNIDIEHDQRSIILPDANTPEVLDDGEVVDAFWRKPKKSNEKLSIQDKETTVRQIDSPSKNQRRISEEFKKPKTTSIGVKDITNEHPNKIKMPKEPFYKEPVSSHKVRPYKVGDDSSLPEKSQLKTKASTPVTKKTTPSVISERKKLLTNSKTENIYDNHYIEEINYDDNIVFARETDTDIYKKPAVSKDTKTVGKIHQNANKKSSPNKTLPYNLPSDKSNKQQPKTQEPRKSPTRVQPGKASTIRHPQKEVQGTHVKRNEKIDEFEPIDRPIPKSPTRKAPSSEPKFGITTSTFTSTTRKSNVETYDAQREYQPRKSSKSPTRKSLSPEPRSTMGTLPSICATTMYKSETQEPEDEFEYQPMKTRKSPTREFESPKLEDNFRGSVSTFTTTTHLSDTQQYEEHPEFKPIKSRTSPTRKPEIPEPKRNIGTITPTFTTGTQKPNSEQPTKQPNYPSTKSTKSPTYKSGSPEPKTNFEATVSTFSTITRKSDVEHYDDHTEFQPTKSGKSPISKPVISEHVPNFRKSASPITTTNVEQPENQREPINSRKSPTNKSKSPEPTLKFQKSGSTITSTTHISDTQQYEEFENRPEFQSVKTQKSPAREPITSETKPSFGRTTSPFIIENVEQPEFQSQMKPKKMPTHQTESFEPTISKPETSEHIPNFRKSASPFTTTNVEQPENQREAINSRKSPTNKSKSPEPTLQFQKSGSTITSTIHISDTQQYEEFEDRPEFQSVKTQKSPAREPITSETKPSFGRTTSPFINENVEQPEFQSQMKPKKMPTHQTESLEPTISKPETSEHIHNFRKSASPFTTTNVEQSENQRETVNSRKSPSYKSKSPEPTLQFEKSSSTVTSTTHISDTQQYEEFEDRPEFQPVKTQKSPTREPKTFESKPNFGNSTSPFNAPNVEKPGAQRHGKPQKSPPRKTEFSEPTDNFGTSSPSTTHISDTSQYEESPEFQSKIAQKSPIRKPETSERQRNIEKTPSTLTSRQFDAEEPEYWPELQPTKSRKSPTHIYESVQPEDKFTTSSSPLTVIKDKPDIQKPEKRFELEPKKSPTRQPETLESKPNFGKTTSVPTNTVYNFDKEKPEEDKRAKFPRPSSRNLERTDIQPTRDSPILNTEFSESTIHFESTDTEKLIPEEESPKTQPCSQNLPYGKSPSSRVSRDMVSQKIDLFNRSDASNENNKTQSTSRKTDYEHTTSTFTRKTKQSSVKKFEDEEYETPETDEDLSKPTEKKSFETDESGKTRPQKEPTEPYTTKKIPSGTLVPTRNVNTEFIESERENVEPELFDGARISKVPTATSPTLTNYRKKGVSSRETFEERCRHILGMEDYGSTHGTFKSQLKPIKPEVENLESENEEYTGDKKKFSVTSDEQTDSQKPYNAPLEKFVESTNRTTYNKTSDYNEVRNYTTNEKRSYESKIPDQQKPYTDISSPTKQKENIKVTKHIPIDEDTLIDDETFPDINQTAPDQINFTFKLEKDQSIKDYDKTNEYSQLKKTPKKSEKTKPQKQTPQTYPTSKNVSNTRPSRKSSTTATVSKPKSKPTHDKSPTLSSQDIKDGSSPETSPHRISDRRKSNTISVNTEIIIDHISPKSEDIKKSPSPTTKPKRKSISTERKDSAPVPRVTRHMKDAKVSRSISENIIKVKGKPKQGTNVPFEKYPKKCFATKTINLAVKDTTDMENVIIDIQHAKSSREVSPNKIVPTPVPADFDVSHLRYPDLVQEPEDEPQRKPIEKNIPIYEEETNDYVGCHISEIYNENSTFREENAYTIDNEQINISDVRTTDDECLLSVQEKVSKFTKSADEVTKPKSSSPFNREFDTNTRVPEDDQCLLTINEKVSKFQKNTSDIDHFQQDVITSKATVPTKLRPLAPQKSPELVRSISKQITTPQVESKFDERDNITKVPQLDDNDNEYERIPHTPNHTNVLEEQRQKEILTRPSVFSKHTQSSTTILQKNQKQKHERVSNNYERASKPVETRYITKHTEIENVQIDNPAQKLPLSRTDGAPTNPEYTFDNNNIQFPENEQIVEHSRVYDQPITKHNKGFKKEPISVHASTRSPTKKVTESTIINKTRRKSFSSDDEVKNISAKTKVTPQTSNKIVTARRNLFEKNIHTDRPKKLEPTTPAVAGRRPSYMDHTKCSLEHMRRDSLEINKSNYLRKLSREDDGQSDRITSVKFDIPQKMAKEGSINSQEEINIEEIYDIEILEQMLQTVTSYELRRRIRAQIRRLRKELIASKTEVDSSIKRRPKHNEYDFVDGYKKRGTNEIVVTTSDAEYETITPNYGQSVVKPKPSSISPERGYRRYNNTEDIDTHPKTSTKFQPNQNIPLKKPMRSTVNKSHPTTVKPSETDSYNRKGSFDHEINDQNTFHRNSIDRKTFTKETNVIKKQYENVAKRSSTEFKSYTSQLDNRSPSPDVTSQTKTTSEYSITKHLRESSPEIRRNSVDYNFNRDVRSPLHDSTIRDRSTSPKSKPHGQVSSNIFESQTPKEISRDKIIHEKRYQTTRDQRTNSQQNVHTKIVDNKRNLNNVNDRSSMKLEQKPKHAADAAPIWANRNNVLRSSTTRKSSNVETQVKEMKFSTVHKDVKNVNKTSTIEQDSVVSSYGIGPTDENGLPLFGIKALRKKPMTSNVTEDITGCVIEEKYYSDNKSKPIVQRKETYYSTNPDQLKEIRGKDAVKQFTDKNTGLYILSKTDQEASENIMKSSLTTTHDDDDDTNLLDAGIKHENIINKNAWRVVDSPDCYDMSSHMERSNQTYTEGYSDADEETFQNYRTIRKNEINKAQQVYSTSTRSFTNLTSSGEKQIGGVNDVLQLMRNADHVVEEGDTEETQEARALLNKFIGASIIMNGAEAALPNEFALATASINNNKNQLKQQEVKIIRKTKTKSGNTASLVTHTTTYDLQDIWDEDILKQLLEQAKSYEERRKIRARLRELMAEREEDKQQQQQQVTTTTEKIQGKSKDGTIMTTTTKVTTRSVTGGTSNKPVSAFTKFKQLDAKNSQQQQQQQYTKLSKTSPSQLSASTTTSISTSSSPSTSSSASTTCTAFGSSSLVQFVDPALSARAATVKEQLLQWCQSKTSEYENIKIKNFSTSWSDGLAFCALIHHFLPNAFDYYELTAENRRKNFETAFTVADEKAGIAPLLDVEDMVAMKCPDWKCVFVYVQSIHRRFRNCQ